MLERSRRSIFIVAGELDSSFFCGQIINKIKQKLDDISSYHINIIFKKDDLKDKTIKQFKKDNPLLVKLLLNPDYSNRVRIYWASKRPRYHFIVADTDTLLEEKDHPANESREVYIRYNDLKLSKEYIQHFNNMLKESDIIHELTSKDFE
ncbi:MAG TPA: hypothetical protein PLP19_21590 [bacterium]|nr:hypothetical protein [bacterium]HPN46092.1 hypothetical protein [bacterium]